MSLPPLILHLVFRFDVGGLENGVVNLVNRLDGFRHAIVAMTEVTDFRERITRPGVQFISLQKPPGPGYRFYPRLYRLFKELQPDILHTRNLGTMEAVLPAWLAGVPVRIHGEHGWDVHDPDGTNPRHRLERRLLRPFVSHFIALSRDIESYLRNKVGIPAAKLSQIYNGVDAERFHPTAGGREPIAGCPFQDSAHWLVGTVGRMQAIKDQVTLARAFVRALALKPTCRNGLRLVMVGEGPLRGEAQAVLAEAGALDLAWLPGVRDDVPHVLRGLDGFVLPSRAEGVSNTILEAMASGLPVIATDVGGNGELVVAKETGELVPSKDPDKLAAAILRQYGNPVLAMAMGRAGRARVEKEYSMDRMVENYRRVYSRALSAAGRPPVAD